MHCNVKMWTCNYMRLKMYMEMRNPGMTHVFVVGDEQTVQHITST